MTTKPKFQILKTPFFRHQTNNVKFHLMHPKTGDWSDCGTGKTLTTLGVFAMRHKGGQAYKMLVVCPLSVMYTWKTEVEKHTSYKCELLTGSWKDKLGLLSTSKAQIFVITYDSVPGRGGTEGQLLQALLDKRFDFLVIDEVTYVKSFKAKRTQSITYLADNIPYSLSLSGTFVPNKAEQILTIYRVMDGGKTFGRHYYPSLRKWFRNAGFSYPDWVLREDKKEEFKRRLFERAVRVMKEECLDLPDKMYLTRYTDISDSQRKLYEQVANELYKEIIVDKTVARMKGDKVKKLDIKFVLPRMQKMRQITGGFVYHDGDAVELLENPKISLLKETIELLPEDDKFVIYYIFKQDGVNIEEMLMHEGIPYAKIDGSVDSISRNLQIKDFQESSLRCMLIQQQSGGFGLNLQVAHNIIYYNHSNSVIEWQQSQDRIHRIGQKHRCNYYVLMCKDTIDEYLYDSMVKKIDWVHSIQNESEVLRLKANLELILGKRKDEQKDMS